MRTEASSHLRDQLSAASTRLCGGRRAALCQCSCAAALFLFALPRCWAAAEVTEANAIAELSLNGTSITDAGMEKLGSLTKLRRLSLNGTKITDAGLEILRPANAPRVANGAAEPRNGPRVGLSSLVELRLEGTAITDTALRLLAKFDHLSILFLSGTKVSDEGMDDLQRTKRVSIRSWPHSGAGGGGGRAERPLPPGTTNGDNKSDGSNY